MAKRTTTRTASGTEIVVLGGGGGALAAPRRRRSGGGGGSKKKGRRRRGGGAAAGGGNIQSRLQRVAIGGFGYGLVVKHLGAQIPRLPGLGRSGVIALAVWLLKPKHGLVQDIGIAAAAIAGASFGETGTVSGDGDEVLTNQ